jgi:hypothetical protein
MTKFGKTEKIELSNLPNWSIRFLQFQSKIEKGVKVEDFKIQGVLKQENGLKDINGLR